MSRRSRQPSSANIVPAPNPNSKSTPAILRFILLSSPATAVSSKCKHLDARGVAGDKLMLGVFRRQPFGVCAGLFAVLLSRTKSRTRSKAAGRVPAIKISTTEDTQEHGVNLGF